MILFYYVTTMFKCMLDFKYLLIFNQMVKQLLGKQKQNSRKQQLKEESSRKAAYLILQIQSNLAKALLT